jgi:hypothetical protein
MSQKGFILGSVFVARLVLIVGISIASDTPWTVAPYPPESEINPVSAEMRSGDADKIAAGELQIHDWLSNGHVVVSNVWWEWFPIMMKIHH